MTSEEWEELALAVALALKTFDWAQSDALCERIAVGIRSDPSGAAAPVSRILKRLRRTRRFQSMALLAEALFESGVASVESGVQYAQALTDTRSLSAAEAFLDWLSQRPDAAQVTSEIIGLRGRIAKQHHVNTPDAQIDRAHHYLDESVRYYLAGFDLDRSVYFWHGINAVALIDRAHRKGIPVDQFPASKPLARSILDTVTSPVKTADLHDVWRIGTELEAYIALNDSVRAADAAVRYAAAEETDAFQIASTLRQLTEVWELTSNAPPGSQVLPTLRAALLAREGGGFRLEPHQVAADLEGSAALEKVFGAGQFKTVKWYQHGLDCCECIARIETSEGNSEGTGWVCRADALFGNGSDKLLLVTNSHVVNAEGGEGALRFDKAAVRFEISGHVSRCTSIVWSSPINECDATILELDSLPPKVVGLSLSDEPLTMPPPSEKARRLYIIGYAGGRGLSFSFDDNVMIACSDRRVHYRTPTEGGSSGSPVFDEDNWDVVALHHAGKAKMPKLDDPASFYEANEGIPIAAIRATIRANT
jgi:Trypsin-like peptidase domain/Tetratricopeptide Repeats-Sensor